jgi:hypothetical protein
MRKSAPRKLTLQRETLRQLGASLGQAAGGRTIPTIPETEGAEPGCNWYSELYSACTCPPSWWEDSACC